jgi:hypothetical protein
MEHTSRPSKLERPVWYVYSNLKKVSLHFFALRFVWNLTRRFSWPWRIRFRSIEWHCGYMGATIRMHGLCSAKLDVVLSIGGHLGRFGCPYAWDVINAVKSVFFKLFLVGFSGYPYMHESYAERCIDSTAQKNITGQERQNGRDIEPLKNAWKKSSIPIILE